MYIGGWIKWLKWYRFLQEESSFDDKIGRYLHFCTFSDIRNYSTVFNWEVHVLGLFMLSNIYLTKVKSYPTVILNITLFIISINWCHRKVSEYCFIGFNVGMYGIVLEVGLWVKGIFRDPVDSKYIFSTHHDFIAYFERTLLY